MRILLINAAVRFFDDMNDVKMGNADFSEPIQAGPSFGLLSIAGVLEKAGHKVANIDPNVFSSWTSFLDRLQAEVSNADVVGVSSLSPTIFNNEVIIRFIRERVPHIPIVAGGYCATLRPRIMLESSEVDVVVAGDGEIAFQKIILVFDRYRSRHPLGNEEAKELLAIDGVGVRYLRDSEERCDGPNGRSRLSINELEALPLPSWTIAPLDAYHDIWRSKYINISTSRGCDRNCHFCAIVDFHGRGPRLLSASTVARLIHDASDKVPSLEHIFFCDAHFTAVPARTLEICDRIVSMKRGGLLNQELGFGCEARVDTLSPGLLERMRTAGFSEIWVGLESGSDKVLDEYGKGLHVDASRQVVQLVKENGMVVIAFLMIASPHSTVADVLATLDLSVYVLENGGDISPDVSYCQIGWEGTRLIQHIRDQDFDVGFVAREFSKRDLASGKQIRKLVAEGGYVLPSDPITRRLVVNAYLYAMAYGRMNTSTLLVGFFMSLRDLFASHPKLRDTYVTQARNLLWRAVQIAEQRKVNNWGCSFLELGEMDRSLF